MKLKDSVKDKIKIIPTESMSNEYYHSPCDNGAMTYVGKCRCGGSFYQLESWVVMAKDEIGLPLGYINKCDECDFYWYEDAFKSFQGRLKGSPEHFKIIRKETYDKLWDEQFTYMEMIREKIHRMHIDIGRLEGGVEDRQEKIREMREKLQKLNHYIEH